MSKRMTSETIIFDTDWLTEADFKNDRMVAKIDYQAYDTLKVIVDAELVELEMGGLFQEFDIHKIENLVNLELDYRRILEDEYTNLEVYFVFDEGDVKLLFNLHKNYWQNNIKGIGSIYIKGVKR